MPNESVSLDERLAALDDRIQTLRGSMPSRALAPSPTPSPKPVDTVQIVLWLFAIAACLLLVQDAIVIFAQPDELVFISVEGHEFHVWQDPWEYQAATGKSWTEQMPDRAAPFAVYHGARRSAALAGLGSNLLLLVLSVVAIRRLRQERRAVEAAITC